MEAIGLEAMLVWIIISLLVIIACLFAILRLQCKIISRQSKVIKYHEITTIINAEPSQGMVQ